MPSNLRCWLFVLALSMPTGHVVADVQSQSDNVALKASTLQSLNSMALTFTQNAGQWPDSVLYRANAGGATMWFTPNGAYYQFTRRIPKAVSGDAALAAGPGPRQPDQADRFSHERDSVETMMIKASFVGCNQKSELTGEDPLDYKCNYFLGNDNSKWRTDVPNYSSVTYKEIYSGIDLKYYGDGRRMEYDFIVAPNADYSQVRISYEGAKSLAVNAGGDLVIETVWGTVTEKAPVVYQMVGSKRVALTGAYRVADSHSFGFSLGAEYDRSLPVVIDPVISYSTYLGGGGYDSGFDIAVDGAGSAYVTGWTNSSDFPTASSYDGTPNGNYDAFVSKLNPAGNILVYSTYMGGGSDEAGSDIAVDSAGSAYVTGVTFSSNFPTVTPFDDTFNGGSYDIFVVKVSPAGNSLLYSSYLGGSGDDSGIGIAVDLAGSSYVTGYTRSSDFPTANAYDGTSNGSDDAFVTKLSPAGNSLVYSSYLGGSNLDNGIGIAVDQSGSAYVTGYTYSSDFPTAFSYDGTPNGSYDAFVTKLSPTGSSLVYSTYLGGSSDDQGWGIAVDGAGGAYVTGYANSSDFPTAAPFDGTFGGTSDAFVTKLSVTGNSLLYSTFLGGSSQDIGYDIAVDGAGGAYVTGYTRSSDFPTAISFDSTYNGNYDAFVAKMTPAGNGLVYSSYLGGSGDERGIGIAVDGVGSAYLTGETYSSDFPTATPFDGTLSGGLDAFVTKVSSTCQACAYSTPLGAAVITDTLGLMQVSNLGTSGNDGVALTSDPADTVVVDLLPVDLSPIGSEINFRFYGTTIAAADADGTRALASGLLAGIGFSSAGGALQIIGDFTSIGDPNVHIVVYNGSTPAGSTSVPGGGVIAIAGSNGAGNPLLIGCSLVRGTFPYAEIKLDRVAKITATNAVVLTGDRIRLISLTSTMPIAGVGQVNVVGKVTGFSVTNAGFKRLGGCCRGFTGNVDGDATDVVDISDLMYLVDYLKASPPVTLQCPAEADTELGPGIDISDLFAVIDFLTVGIPPASCH